MSERKTTTLEENALKYIETELRPDLQTHVISTRDFALEINRDQNLGLDDEKVALAALCHDLARFVPPAEIEKRLTEAGIQPESLNAATPMLLHGPLSAIIARDELGIGDKEVLRAIWIHATGAGEMSTLDRLIYVADKIEPTRTYEGVQELRLKVREDFHSSFRFVISAYLAFLVARGQPLDYNSIAAYNSAVGEFEEPPDSM